MVEAGAGAPMGYTTDNAILGQRTHLLRSSKIDGHVSGQSTR